MTMRKIQKTMLAVGAAALLALFSAACQRQAETLETGPEASSEVAPAAKPASLEAMKTGEFAELDLSQELSLPTSPILDIAGKEHALTDYAGKVVVLNIWAEWCAPCVEEMPTLAALQKEFAGSDVVVVPVAFGYPDKRESAEKKLEQLVGKDLPFFYDSSYNVTYDAKTAAFPSTVIYGRDGKEVARLMRPANWGSPEALALVKAISAGAS